MFYFFIGVPNFDMLEELGNARVLILNILKPNVKVGTGL